MTTTSRPNWDETRIEMARVIAKRSLCVRDQVGAIITDTENKIIGEGYNGPPSEFAHEGQPCAQWCDRALTESVDPDRLRDVNYGDCPALHAEANALIMSDRSLRQGGTIYVTSAVCFSCAKLIANSGIFRVYVVMTYDCLYRDPMKSFAFLTSCGLAVEAISHTGNVFYKRNVYEGD